MIIRWICEKCSKKWIYPVEKCIYCKGPITKQRGIKLKVSGMTKVNIPSPMHPITPYNILLLEDEHGNRLPKKTMKDYKIGEEYIEEKAKTKDAVAVVKVKYDIYEAIKESLNLANIRFDSKDKILVKPSIVAAAYPYQAVNTNPEFMDALIRILFESGIKKEGIIVAEQALIGSNSKEAAAKSGILEVCKKHGVEFYDISKGPFTDIESDGHSFNIFKEALDRKIVNCPVMKTNFQFGISGAAENLSRLVDEQTQRKMYFDDIYETLPKLVKAIPDAVAVADATNGMQGQGPLAIGEPAFLNIVMAGSNVMNIDKVFCETFMLPNPKYLEKLNVNNIEVVGSSIDALKYPIKHANAKETAHPDIKVIDGGACPACLRIMNNITSRLVGLRGDKITIVMGSKNVEGVLEGIERPVILGDCAIKSLSKAGLQSAAKIDESIGEIEQLVLMKKLLMTKGVPKITPVDTVKSKMKKLLSKVVK